MPTRIGGGLRFYGASVGAVRGAVRDARRRHPELTHDEVTALASELWSEPVYERRLAAVVLLQGQVPTLLVSDFTRLEQLLRSAGARELVDPLVADVVRPLLDRLEGVDAARARRIVDRWESRGPVARNREGECPARDPPWCHDVSTFQHMIGGSA